MSLKQSFQRAIQALRHRYNGGQKHPYPKVVAWLPLGRKRKIIHQIIQRSDRTIYESHSTRRVLVLDSNGEFSEAYRKDRSSLPETYIIALGRQLKVNIPAMLLDEAENGYSLKVSGFYSHPAAFGYLDKEP